MRLSILILCIILPMASSCSSIGQQAQAPEVKEAFAPSRPALYRQDCLDAGANIIGDIGDGRIHRQDYLCPNNQPPLGTIIYSDGEAMPIEGEVCCGR